MSHGRAEPKCGPGTVITHLGSLVLEPNLYHPHGQARLGCQGLSYLSAKPGELNQNLSCA